MNLTFRAALVAAGCLAALPALAEGTLERIKADGTIRLGVRADAAPISYTGPDGQPAGYAVDVCKAVAQALAQGFGLPALKTSFVPVTAENRFDTVAQGKVDLLCGADTVTLQRREEVDFSLPTFVDGAAVLIKTGTNPDLAALAGKKVGVVAGTTTEDALKNTLAQTGIQAEVVALPDHNAGIEALKKGEVAAYFGDQAILYHLLLSADPDKTLAISDNTLTVEKQALALPRGDDDFRLAVDGAISELYRSGGIARIFAANLPGAKPGLALKALYLIAPDLP
ncbi:MAG: amino acid ABC transporter substrate-binding protein [Amaricoccus sp.]